MNIQGLIDYCNVLKESKNRIINCIDVDGIIDKIKQLDEPQPVKVKQFVADWITHSKNIGRSLFGAMSIFEENFEIKKWMQWAENQETFALAWIFGYEVEKESKYIVKVKATGQCLGKYYINNEILSPRFIYTGRHADSFTRKELEEADFSWVFDCDGVGVEEVE
jgi:phage protein